MRSRLLASLLDQAAYSIQNFAVAFVALHSLELAPLGALSLAMTLVILAHASLRAGVLEPLTIRASRSEVGSVREMASMAAGLSVCIGVAAGALTAGAGWWLGGPHGSVVAWSGVVLLLILVQDSWRFGLFAARRLWAATLNDTVACAVTIATLGGVSRLAPLDGGAILAAWAAGSLAGLLLGMVQLRIVPRPGLARRWFDDQRRLGLPLMGSVLAQQSMGRLSLVIVSAIGGPAQLGLLNAARIVLTPVNTLIAATYGFAVPDAVRRLERSRRSLVRYTTLLGLALAGFSIVLTAVLLALPHSWGALIAGDNWDEARSLLVPTCLWIVGVGLSQGARVGLRALEQGGVIFRVSLVLGALLLVSTTAGVLVDGGRGAAWGFGVASLLGQVLWTFAYRRELRRS